MAIELHTTSMTSALRRSYFATAVRLGTLIVLAGSLVVIRMLLLDRIRPHVDEASSLLAIEQAGVHGYPMLPSGVLYTQGLLFTYLATPLTWMLTDPMTLLNAARWLNIGVSLVTAGVAYLLTKDLTESWIAGAGAMTAVGLDPSFAEWSIWIRPYGLLTCITLLIALVAIRAVRDGPTACVMRMPLFIWIVVLGWAGIFTHVLVGILVPAVIVVFVILGRKYGLRALKSTILAIVLALSAPAILLVLNMAIGAGSGSGGSANLVVGSHLITDTLQNPNQTYVVWTWLFDGSRFDNVMPFIFLLSAGMLLGLATDPARANREQLAVLLAFAILPIMLMMLIVPNDGQPRYVAHVFPFGYIVIAVVAATLIQERRGHAERAGRTLVAIGMVFVTLLYGWQGTTHRIVSEPGGNSNYHESISWLEAHRAPSDQVILALPQLLVYADDRPSLTDHALFLAGPEGQQRTKRYVKTSRSGDQVDYWMGVPAITSTHMLCATIRTQPAATWIMVDEFRLNDPRFFAGEMASLIRGTSKVVLSGPNLSPVWKVLPEQQWSADALAICPQTS